ncbi:solute carrier family 2, facilitated glucose transporter member 3 [Nilaparvata lugens]|uniref:solute carrier family 2, facilitated glucose transporter member 3 n=1 Tax=Nilaparvata lugens TaxID=108931 RepID=UPI00193C9931|nr:solute carrier family 2, facilitated glucose transporter member 3 [Nilaparvata lugens]
MHHRIVKGTLIVSGVLGVVAGILFLTCKDPHLIEFIFIGRFLVGLSSGLITGVMPMYLCEIAPPNLRGVMGVLPTRTNIWRLSPKYLYHQGLKQRACRDMSRLRGEPLDSVSRELESQGALNEITSEGWTIARLLATRNLRLPLALTCALQAGQQTSGINAVFYYSMKIFESAGLNVAEQQYASLGAGLVNFGVAVIMLPLVNKLPHRKLTISSSCLATLTLFLLTISISYIKTYYWMPYLCVFSVMFYVLVYGIGLGPIPYFIGSELFEVGPRPSAMALGSVANWTGNFSVGMLFPSLQRVMGPYSFLIFAFCTSLLTIFLHMFLPETNPRHMYEREESHESTNTCQQSTTDRMLFKSIHDL